MRGLDDAEAGRRLAHDGPNELPASTQRTSLRIVGEVVRQPMFALLLCSGAIYLVLGDAMEGIVLLVFASLSVSISVVQETRSERVLQALRTMSSPRALVIRQGVRKRIPGREVVRGDMIVLAEGDRVPADATVLQATDLMIDESLLTGESVAVRKRARLDGEAASVPGGDDLPTVFSGTLVVRGWGVAEVTATGAGSELGRIGRALANLNQAVPHLAVQTGRLVRVFAVVGVVTSLTAVLAYGFLRGSWLEASLAGIALGMSLMPEEFPLVLTVFMVAGAWRISRERVLTRRSSAIETLGSATVLCTDKTGTLTENRMTVVTLSTDEGAIDASGGGDRPAEYDRVLRDAALASAAESIDPMDLAILRAGGPAHADGMTRIRSYGLTPDLLAVAQVWRRDSDGYLLVAAKGAPETLVRLCGLDEAQATEVRRQLDILAARGERVLAVAEARHDGGLPDTPRGFALRWIGLIGLADPLRKGVRAAIRECRDAGIRVVMITGDYPVTARAIGSAAGLNHREVVTGAELAGLSDAELAARIRQADIFARILPEQKLRIVRALQALGEVVAMTGDGVNDAPSLKAADIGIAMGGRGTDVAREASSLVLLDDNFTSIVRTIRLGRRIYDNLRKAMTYIIAVHIPIAGLALLPLLTGYPMVLLPLHIAFIEMIIDPACSIAFEAERAEDDVMRRPPRPTDSELFSRPLVLWSVVQGLLALAAVTAVYFLAVLRGLPETDVRSLSFFTLVLTNFALIVVNRAHRGMALDVLRGRNPVFLVIGLAAGILLVVSVAWPPARALLGFGPLHADDGLVIATAVALVVVALFLLKPVARLLKAI